MGRPLGDLTAPQIANVAWAFSKACLSAELTSGLFGALARSATQRASDFGAQDVASIAWAFVNSGQIDQTLFTSLAGAAERLLDDFNDEELDNAEWAFAKAGQQKIAKSLRQTRKRAASTAAVLATGPPVDVSKCGRIVIAGGGIGGAAAAVALQQKGFSVVVLEADQSFDARKQGYGLTIQRQDATQAMGINLAQDDAPSTSHYTFAADGSILGFYGEAFSGASKERAESENSGRFVHIPRQMLRARMVEQIQPDTIQWGSRLKSFACHGGASRADHTARVGLQPSESSVTVTLEDGSSLDAALLVGSDGIFSTVRRDLNLAGDRLNYVGLVVVLGIIEDGAMGSAPLTRRRIFETVDGVTRIYAMPFTTSSTMWQLSFPAAEMEARAMCKDQQDLKAEILRRCADWHDPIPALLRNTPLDCFSGYPVYDRELLDADVLRPPPAAGETRHIASPSRAAGCVGCAGCAGCAHLANNVVEGRLEACSRRLGNGVDEVGQQLAERQLGGHGGEGVASCLRGESR